MINESSVEQWLERNRLIVRRWVVDALRSEFNTFAIDANAENPDQPRDENGQFAETSGGGAGTTGKTRHLSAVISGALRSVDDIKEFARQAAKNGLDLNNKDVEEFGKKAYNAAMEKGGRHNGFYRANGGDAGGEFAARTASKTQRSMEKQIDTHIKKINNPQEYVPEFDTFSRERQDAIIREWRDDIIGHVEQRAIAKGIVEKWGKK